MPNMISKGLKTLKLLRCHCSCHGNLVTIVMRYFAGVHCPQEALHQIEFQYNLRQSSVLTHHCGYHGNIVTKATRYVTNICCLKEALY